MTEFIGARPAARYLFRARAPAHGRRPSTFHNAVFNEDGTPAATPTREVFFFSPEGPR